MYLSPKKHILSGALIACALIRLGGSFIAAAIRLVLRKGGSALPDMLIEQSEAARSAISAVQVLLSAAVISAAFIAAFALLRMASVNILNTQIGIVWTSVIFHFVETAGLLLLALYLRERYNGV